MNTYQETQPRTGLIGLFLGLVMVCFLLMLGLFLIGAILKLAPLLGFFIAASGGVWYYQAKTEHYKLRAMSTVALGLLVMVVGIIF